MLFKTTDACVKCFAMFAFMKYHINFPNYGISKLTTLS